PRELLVQARRVPSTPRRFSMSVPAFLAKLFSHSGRRKPVSVRPVLEPLDDRALLAGNITTALAGGNLTITENTTTSQVTISQPAPNQITITPDAGTTINGKAGPVTVMGVTGGVSVNMGTGTNTLTFDLSKADIDVSSVSITGGTG